MLVTKMPPEQAVPVAERLGLKLSRCLLDREAHRQGLKAQIRRSETVSRGRRGHRRANQTRQPTPGFRCH